MNPKSIALPLFLAAQTTLTSATIVDLSDKLSIDQGAIDTSPGSMAVNFAAMTYSAIRTAMVLEGGKIVASYVREGVDGDALFDAYSTTKSWMSMLVGILVDEGKLTVNTTLGDIFKNQTVWAAVNDVDFRKAITIKELLTHSSGLQIPFGGIVYTSLVDTLNQPTIGTKGTFTYLWTGDIMSYVILELTGLSPKQFLVQKVLPSLGIDSSEVTWALNLDGVEQGSTGMRTNAEQMAKFGQLYLQGGMASESKRIFSQGWLEQSWTTYFVTGAGFPYGYLWYGMPGSDTHCAFGIGGQDICISPTMDRVVVQQADPNPLNLTENSGIISTVALNPLLSFVAPTSAPTNRPTSSPAGSKASKGTKSSKTA